MITSPANERIKWVRSLRERKDRREHGAYLVEGVRLVEELLAAGIRPTLALYVPEAVGRIERARALLAAIPESARVPVTERVLRTAADTVMPQGILAIAPLPPPAERISGLLAAVLDGIQDPGNLGTILRSARAAGIEAVITSATTVDPFSPKVVRAGMGAHFHLAIAYDRPWPAIDRLTAGRRRLVAAIGRGERYDRVDWTVPTALLVGGEAHGAGAEAEGWANEHVHIPMATGAESLNAAVAASILFFEAYRQRL